jgi:hypothetical protein
MSVVMVMKMLVLCLLSLFAAFIDDLDVIVENRGDDRDHVSFDNTRSHIFRPADTNIDHALKCQVPLPNSHHILAATLLEDADKALDAAIDSEDIANAG